ncbi:MULTISPECIES: TOBE domain-containing protein [Rhizobium]
MLRDAGNAFIGMFRKLYKPASIFPLSRLETSGAAETWVRPESVEMSSGAPDAGAMPGRVADVVTLGAFRHVVLDLVSGDRIISACPNRPDITFARGQEISVSIPPQAAFYSRNKLALTGRSLRSPGDKGHQLPEGHGSSNIHLRAERPSALERHKVWNAASDA